MNSGIISNEEQIKSKLYLKNLKSDYFLIKIFDIIKKNKSLEIMRYNKNLQKRFNLSINNYKEYSQILSPIEIELKLVDKEYGRFINISDEQKDYFHIYFNNSNEEIKINYLKKNEKVKMIKIVIDFQVISFKDLFFGCYCISSIFFKKFYRVNINNMSDMLNSCSSLKELNISNFNTNNVRICLLCSMDVIY